MSWKKLTSSHYDKRSANCFPIGFEGYHVWTGSS